MKRFLRLKKTTIEVITLQEFYKEHNCNATQSAKVLGMHRNTFKHLLNTNSLAYIIPLPEGRYTLLAQGRWA